jgi:hypothetical protein
MFLENSYTVYNEKNRILVGWLGYSNNERIPTQFLIHKIHLEIFDWVYPPEIPNWGVDDMILSNYYHKHNINIYILIINNIVEQNRTNYYQTKPISMFKLHR